jgi:hypothetical protein
MHGIAEITVAVAASKQPKEIHAEVLYLRYQYFLKTLQSLCIVRLCDIEVSSRFFLFALCMYTHIKITVYILSRSWR